MLINKKLAYAIATGAILLNTAVPAAFADTAAGTIGNGAESTNTVNVTQNNSSTATQNNNAAITNTVHTTSSTGGNNANYNTGGDNKIQTGAAMNQVSISNTANSNQLNMGGNGGSNDPLVKVTGNGAFSDNTTNLTTNNNKTATQNNNADFTNNVDANAKTGGNSASDNTGGNTSIFTGPATNAVQVQNAANKNVMTGAAFGNTGATTLDINGNGALSGNTINDTMNTNAVATQNNAAFFANTITGGAKTGKNDANYNTDGANFIQTGSALNMTGVSNVANANVMNALECGCATTPAGDIFKEAENGAFSTSTENATKNDNKTATQNNAAAFANAVDTDAFTGNNSVSDATGSYFFGGMNGVMTGASGSQTEVSNTSNYNEVSDGMSFGGMTFTWNPSDMFSWMMGM